MVNTPGKWGERREIEGQRPYVTRPVSSDPISSELRAPRLVAAAANWVAPQRTTHFAAAATSHVALTSAEMMSDEMSDDNAL